MSKKFLDAARQGRNHWGLYLLVLTVLSLYWWDYSGQVFLYCQRFLSDVFNINADNSIVNFASGLVPFIPIVLLLIVSVKKLHHRQFTTLVNAKKTVRFKRLFLGFAVWGIVAVVLLMFDRVVHPQNYAFTFEPNQWFLLLLLGLILVPIQTSAEEFLYRGYLMQGLGFITRQPFILIIVTSLAFALPHFGNPEMQRGEVWGALTYFLWGVFFAALTLKDNGLELALGVHAANNLFAFLVLNTTDSVLPTPAVLTYIATIDAKEAFLALLIQAGIFYIIFFARFKRRVKST